MQMDAKQALEWAQGAFLSKEQARYATYDAYLRGDQPLEFATPKFRTAFGKAFAAFAYNRMGMVVDALADRLQITGFSSDDEEVSQRALALWNANRMDVQEGVTEREQFSMGDAYVIVERDPETGHVHIWPQKATSVRVRYSEEHPGRIDIGAKRWRDDAKQQRLTLYFADRIEKYRAPGRGGFGEVTTWEPYAPDNEPWPLPLGVTDTAAVFHFANNAGIDNMGISELHDVMPIQDALNKSLMDLLVAMEFAAFPQRVLVNVDTNDEGTDDSIRRFVAGIDQLLTLYGSGDGLPVQFGEFAAANIQQYVDVVEMLDTLISRVSKVPVHYLKLSGQFPSGESLRMGEAPFIAKVEDRQRANGAVWAEVMRYALRVDGLEAAPGAITVSWQSAAPMSREEKMTRARDMLAIGFSFAEILRDMGYDPDTIALIQAEKQAEDDERIRRFNAGSMLEGMV